VSAMKTLSACLKYKKTPHCKNAMRGFRKDLCLQA
jgi:hypothetical protein